MNFLPKPYIFLLLVCLISWQCAKKPLAPFVSTETITVATDAGDTALLVYKQYFNYSVDDRSDSCSKDKIKVTLPQSLILAMEDQAQWHIAAGCKPKSSRLFFKVCSFGYACRSKPG